MSRQTNTEIVRGHYDAINTHQIDQARDLWAAEFEAQEPGEIATSDASQHAAFLSAFLVAFPDVYLELVRLISDGDYVVAQWIATGTHRGPLHTGTGNTIPPTQSRVTLTGSETFEIKNDKIARIWAFFDRLALLNQLGLA